MWCVVTNAATIVIFVVHLTSGCQQALILPYGDSLDTDHSDPSLQTTHLNRSCNRNVPSAQNSISTGVSLYPPQKGGRSGDVPWRAVCLTTSAASTLRDASGRDARGVTAAAGTAAGALGVGAVVAGAKGRLGLEGHTIPVIEVCVEGDGRLWDPPAWAAEVLQSGPGFGYSW